MDESCKIRAFDLPLSKINTLSSSRKTELAIALALSTDLEYPFRCLHIDQTCKMMDVRFQRIYGICLGKKQAQMMIEDYISETISPSSFLKKSRQQDYEKLFGYEAATGDRSAVLATFAEWLHLFGYTDYPLNLPNAVAQWLPDDWDNQRANLIAKLKLPTTETLLSKRVKAKKLG